MSDPTRQMKASLQAMLHLGLGSSPFAPNSRYAGMETAVISNQVPVTPLIRRSGSSRLILGVKEIAVFELLYQFTLMISPG